MNTQSAPAAEQATRKVNLLEGAKVGFGTPISPIFIVRLRSVGFDKQTIEAQLEQMFEAPLGNQGAVLAMTMEGHSAFNSGPRKRVTWQNFSTITLIRLGIISKWEDVGEAIYSIEGVEYKGWLVPEQPIEFKFRNARGVALQAKIVERDSFIPREWKNADGTPGKQRPKTAGDGGDLLIFKDSKGVEHSIYANRVLTFQGTDDATTGVMWDEDIVIQHNNTIVGSSVRANMAKANISLPLTPGSPVATGNASTQNKRPGYVSNLLKPLAEPTRTAPTAASPEVAEKTKAEEAREAGERAPESQVTQ